MFDLHSADINTHSPGRDINTHPPTRRARPASVISSTVFFERVRRGLAVRSNAWCVCVCVSKVEHRVATSSCWFRQFLLLLFLASVLTSLFFLRLLKAISEIAIRSGLMQALFCPRNYSSDPRAHTLSIIKFRSGTTAYPLALWRSIS